jgi:hypothetical protein
MELDKICLKFDGEKVENRYIFKTKYGTLRVVDLKDDTFIPMMFEDDFNLNLFLSETHDHTIGKYSYKWNLHSSDKEFNLERLEQRLSYVRQNT